MIATNMCSNFGGLKQQYDPCRQKQLDDSLPFKIIQTNILKIIYTPISSVFYKQYITGVNGKGSPSWLCSIWVEFASFFNKSSNIIVLFVHVCVYIYISGIT